MNTRPEFMQSVPVAGACHPEAARGADGRLRRSLRDPARNKGPGATGGRQSVRTRPPRAVHGVGNLDDNLPSGRAIAQAI